MSGHLEIRGLQVRFGRATILQGIDLSVLGAPLSVVGRNGMGKTTMCSALMGMVSASGSAKLDGKEILGLGTGRVARSGIALVPQGRRMFPSLSVHEHLVLVAQKGNPAWTIDRVYETFPRLAERRRNGGDQLSGGEQQMLAISRALLMNPKLVIMDEPSEGLAPVIVDHLIEVLRNIATEGMGLLLIEQNLRVATSVSEQVAIMVTGKIAATLNSAELAADRDLQNRYLGVSHGH
ncbi:ABC transporter ATP-binding protein [Roseinatronobacter bogoriensis]|uniref:ABC transporter ATP-binding protein n=1 Tax=Roseinatronobacter bogoriensis subsp. barguzinensis TaxID=441209 RepID=A0A2K8K8F8_9RHOB|nr:MULTISPECIES: ABC transporter ATP-binding protein [Rhodobaca]ATX65732.1 ABC transporter ATP-binding protein [Rhodobaca barguzinensis]MBB4208321.1 branched-chain amino acid transport system ATP-binding protein [Rhodobaca bogoriensis DSM 18756]TDW38962.1 amino acid/amide ABC transporter ATP-binding protein 2 (HAAT family) [Rhodobaca barguzinensis]TDY68855.1 amino acid/amide ABC transporter ATP-binding protein 2 (HAAT family) [Rhodobaca bogoriensis DSM 18756]